MLGQIVLGFPVTREVVIRLAAQFLEFAVAAYRYPHLGNVDARQELLNERGGFEILLLIVKHVGQPSPRHQAVRFAACLGHHVLKFPSCPGELAPPAEPLGHEEVLEQVRFFLAGVQGEGAAGGLLGPILLPLLGIGVGQHVQQAGVIGETLGESLGQLVHRFPRLLVHHPGKEFRQGLRVAGLHVDQPADRRHGRLGLAQLLQPGRLKANQPRHNLLVGLLRRLPQRLLLVVDEPGPLGHYGLRLVAQPNPRQQPSGARPLAARQNLADRIGRSRLGWIGGHLAAEERQRRRLGQQQGLLETHQPAQGRRALPIGQGSERLQTFLARSHVRRLVVAQQLLHGGRVGLRRPLHPHQLQQVFRPGGNFQIAIVRGGTDGVEGLESQLGQLVLCPLADEVILVAQLADESVNLLGGGRLLGSRLRRFSGCRPATGEQHRDERQRRDPRAKQRGNASHTLRIPQIVQSLK